MIYLSLFFIAFLSGSLLPLGSEALLIYDINSGYNIFWLLAFATFGNVLGAVLNYYLGRKGEGFIISKGYINKNKFQDAKTRFSKMGAPALLLSSLPIIGDPITFIAGVLKYNFKYFLILVTLSKAVRYIFIILITQYY